MSAYQGASHTDLALSDWQPMAGSADADLLPELGTLTSRARDLARNDGLMAGGLQTHRDNVVGAVLRLSAVPDYRLLGWTPEQAREWGNKVEAHFRSWADATDCDAARTLDLLGLTVLALGGEMVNGDAVAIPKWLPRPDSPWATRLSVIEADRLETRLTWRAWPAFAVAWSWTARARPWPITFAPRTLATRYTCAATKRRT